MSQAGIPSKLPFKTKLGYGAAELSSTLTWTMVSVLFLFYLTDIVGLDPAFAGFVLMLGALWDAVSDPTVGVMSDRFKSRWGRRRPFLLAVAFFIWMIGIILSKIGYVAGQVQTDGVLWGIRLLYAEGAAFFLLLSIVGAYFLPMNRKRHAALKKAIQQNKAGEKWDEASLKAIL